MAEKYNKMLSLIKGQADKQVQSCETPLLILAGKFLSVKPEAENGKKKDFIQYAIDYNKN